MNGSVTCSRAKRTMGLQWTLEAVLVAPTFG